MKTDPPFNFQEARQSLSIAHWRPLTLALTTDPDSGWSLVESLIESAPDPGSVEECAKQAIGPFVRTSAQAFARIREQGARSPRMLWLTWTAVTGSENAEGEALLAVGSNLLADAYTRSVTKESAWDQWSRRGLDAAVDLLPDLAWQTILKVTQQAPRLVTIGTLVFDVMGGLGAGPLGELVVQHGPAYIDLIEAEADGNEEFRHALDEVWLDGADDDVRTRVALLQTPNNSGSDMDGD